MTITDDIVAALVSAQVQAIIDASFKTPQQLVHVNGVVVTDVLDMTIRHGVDLPVGTCALTVPLPMPANITPGAPIQVQLGYPDAMYTVFRGTIPKRQRAFSISGARATINAVSDGDVLANPDYVDVKYAGPISLRSLFQAICKRRKVKSYRADTTTYPNGTTTITFGNTLDANKRVVIVPRKTTSLAFLVNAANLFGYRVFDTPGGMRMQRVSGQPDAGTAISVTEAWNALALGHDDDTSTIVNYWDVYGVRYTDPDGVTVALHSFPATTPFDARISPNGIAYGEISSELLDTIALCDAVRNVAEIDHREPYEPVTWETHGAPHLTPGDVANVTSPVTALSGKQWIMSVEHTWTKDGGFHTRCEGWRGMGAPLAAGQDCVTTSIPGLFHIGDEYVPWYAKPNPGGTTIKIPFTVADFYSSITIRCLGHGTNSYLLDGANTESQVSRFEVHQGAGPDPVGSGNLPVLNEDYTRQLPYGSSDTYWSQIVVPITGQLEPGAAELWIVSGKDTRAAGGPIDDAEIKNITVTTCGAGTPVIGVPL